VIVLGFDTSTRSTAVGLRLAAASALQRLDDPGPGEHPGHATRLLGMADELLTAAGIEWAQLDRIAVGLGPGRFTGLRVGVATARGLAQSLSAELVGVSTLRALAEPALAGGGEIENVLTVIDALRGELFAAGFASGAEGVRAELEISRPLQPAELSDAVRRAGGGELSRWHAVGDGAIRYRAELESAGAVVPEDSSALHRVDGRAVCEIGARSQPADAHEELLPDYRRRPDAEGVRGATRAASLPASHLEGARA
jgi:tRNA threonylcarbamoyladenosine biosynthesis protein TsaB